MYTKHLIEQLASHLENQPSWQSAVTTQLHDVYSEALQSMIEVGLVIVGENPKTLFIHLDGGVGDRNTLISRMPLLAIMTQTKVIPDALHVSFSGGAQAFYTGAWQTWIIDELGAWLQKQFEIPINQENTVITGISAGGHGALKIAFKYPHYFSGVAALEPVVMPTLGWGEAHTRASWWMLEESAKAVWGEPFPRAFVDEQPINLAHSNSDQIRKCELDIYLEVGDEDLMNLQDGTELLHRMLWSLDIPHEYHLVRWADHGGYSIDDRFVEAMAFLAASLKGGKKQSRNKPLSNAEKTFINYVLSGGPQRGEPLPDGAASGTKETELSVMDKLWEPLREIAQSRDPTMSKRFGDLPSIELNDKPT